MSEKKHLYASALAIGALLAFGMGGVMAESFYREYVPRVDIDPAKGVEGDIQFSGTLQYWKDEKALEKHKGWIGDHANEWKLNRKFMDLDRIPFHEGHLALEEGEALVKSLGKEEPGFKTCLGEGKSALKGAATKYPKYDDKLGRIMTIESRVEYCAKATLRREMKQGSPTNNAITMYVKAQSTGLPLQVDIQSKPVMEAYRRGENLFYMRVGQLNNACASCHTPQGIMGHKLRGEVPTSPFGDAAAFPAYRFPLAQIESLQQRFGICSRQSRIKPLKPGDPAYVDLEVFLTVLSNGFPITVPAAR